MKTFLRWSLGGLGILFILGLVLFFIFDKPLPKGTSGPKAEQLADKVLKYINNSSWEETEIIEWNFADRHTFLWDKKRHFAEVKWDDKRVLLNINHKQGLAYQQGNTITDSSKQAELVQKAYEYWANDSFWLNPLSKIRDAGTKRSLVPLNENGYEGLLVTYTSGGVTPGDSYLWWVNPENGKVDYCQMWVQIIPLGGVKFSWEDWITTSVGTKIATSHKGFINVAIKDIKAYRSLAAYGNEDPFKNLTDRDSK